MKKYTQIIKEKKEQIKQEKLLENKKSFLRFLEKFHNRNDIIYPYDEEFEDNKTLKNIYVNALFEEWKKYKLLKKYKKIKNVNESKNSDKIKNMIGDGGKPNYFFVTISDDYYFEKNDKKLKYSDNIENAPVEIKTTNNMGSYTFGPFLNFKEAKLFSETIDLSEINGPRMVKISDRRFGELYSRFLVYKLKPVWIEDFITKNIEYDDDEENEYQNKNLNTEYTYRDEEE